MPKDEFDFDDPMELNGIGLACAEDTTEAMTECFVEEFMRLGYNHKQILALFRNPHYIGMNMALQNRGEDFVRDKIGEIFARWGRAITWLAPVDNPLSMNGAAGTPRPPQSVGEAGAAEGDARAQSPSIPTDPMGAPIPDILR